MMLLSHLMDHFSQVCNDFWLTISLKKPLPEQHRAEISENKLEKDKTRYSAATSQRIELLQYILYQRVHFP